MYSASKCFLAKLNLKYFNRNPTPKELDLLQNVTWPLLSIDGENFYYLDIDKDITLKNHPKKDTYKKWLDLYDSLDINDFDTF